MLDDVVRDFMGSVTDGVCPVCGERDTDAYEPDEGIANDHWFERRWKCENCGTEWVERFRMVPDAIWVEEEGTVNADNGNDANDKENEMTTATMDMKVREAALKYLRMKGYIVYNADYDGNIIAKDPDNDCVAFIELMWRVGYMPEECFNRTWFENQMVTWLLDNNVADVPVRADIISMNIHNTTAMIRHHINVSGETPM